MKKIIHAPYIDQTARWPNGCESVSAVMLLQTLGIPADPDTFIARDLPNAPYWESCGERFGPDPHFIYPGDPHNQTGCGCYAPCICTALESALAAAGAAERFMVVDETGQTAAQLCAKYIDHNLPVIFWATIDFKPVTQTESWRLENGEEFIWRCGEHCLLLVGYDEDSYWFNDPWHGHGLCKQPKALVEECHKAQGMYAVALWPKCSDKAGTGTAADTIIAADTV